MHHTYNPYLVIFELTHMYDILDNFYTLSELQFGEFAS